MRPLNTRRKGAGREGSTRDRPTYLDLDGRYEDNDGIFRRIILPFALRSVVNDKQVLLCVVGRGERECVCMCGHVKDCMSGLSWPCAREYKYGAYKRRVCVGECVCVCECVWVSVCVRVCVCESERVSEQVDE